MKTLIKAGLVLLFPAFIASCTNSGANADLKAKTEKLDKLKEQKTKIDDEITDLQKQISQQDTSFKLPVKPKLVALSTIGKSDFKHYIELQGSVDSKNISYITPTGQGGQIKAIYVKQGDKVHKGQLILKLECRKAPAALIITLLESWMN